MSPFGCQKYLPLKSVNQGETLPTAIGETSRVLAPADRPSTSPLIEMGRNGAPPCSYSGKLDPRTHPNLLVSLYNLVNRHLSTSIR